jgi:hypothetical protein
MNKALFLACLMVGAAIAEPTEKEPFWTEYALSFSVQDGHQPFLTMRWWSMKAPGPFQEYAEIWRKNVRVGYGDRFLVEDITGLDYDGNKKKDKVVVVTILDTITVGGRLKVYHSGTGQSVPPRGVI